ncbi:hypothetical protein [Citrobacter youngae]|uniref:hypothetical protein n=1 Tax=Citrobacter youngae TaxID=133448 RepID=UPI00397DB9F3
MRTISVRLIVLASNHLKTLVYQHQHQEVADDGEFIQAHRTFDYRGWGMGGCQ